MDVVVVFVAVFDIFGIISVFYFLVFFYFRNITKNTKRTQTQAHGLNVQAININIQATQHET